MAVGAALARPETPRWSGRGEESVPHANCPYLFKTGGSMGDEDPVFGNVIYSYTRKQAIEDGVLVDITEIAKEAGSKYPVAITSTAFFGYVAPDPMPPGQDLKGRLWDLFTMFKLAARKTDGPNLEFNVQFVLGGAQVGPTERPVKNIDNTWNWKLVEVTLQAV